MEYYQNIILKNTVLVMAHLEKMNANPWSFTPFGMSTLDKKLK